MIVSSLKPAASVFSVYNVVVVVSPSKTSSSFTHAACIPSSVRYLANILFISFSDSLGIIFGVASVIAMLSIGEGAKREAIAKYQDLGVNNIIGREKDMSDEELEEVRTKFSPGLSLLDAEVIREIVPGVSRIAAQAEINADVKYGNRTVKSSVIGVTPDFYDILNYQISEGEFVG